MKRSDAVENRKKIMEALSVYLKNGKQPLPTMSDIVNMTDLGRGTIYRNFADIGELFYAYLQDGYTELYSSYEPEWIDDGDEVLIQCFQQFLFNCFEFNENNHTLLVSPACLTSEGLALAKVELRRKIFVTLTKISKAPLKPIELTKWVDVMAHCVETEHLASSSLLETQAETSVKIAMTLFFACLQKQQGKTQ